MANTSNVLTVGLLFSFLMYDNRSPFCIYGNTTIGIPWSAKHTPISVNT